MNLSELLSKGLVEKFQPDPKDVKNEIDIAKNDGKKYHTRRQS